MQANFQDIADFNAFAVGKLSSGASTSIVDLAKEWEAWRRQEYEETVAELRECLADMEAGKGRPLAEFEAEMRSKYNIPADV